MNDRFRYRVWDKTQNKWLHFDFSTYPTYQDRIWQALTDGETFYQCTGLKDKNGKLIYEGDIATFEKSQQTGKLRKGVVKYYKQYCWFFVEVSENNWARPFNAIPDRQYLEVIGNIYENKELLESEG